MSRVRLHSLNLPFVLGTAAMLSAGCGPEGPPNLEGFGDVGETESTPGDGDGDDPGDGDGEPGDGDGDEPSECIEADYGSEAFINHGDYLSNELSNDHEGQCGPNPASDYSIAWRAPDSGTYRTTLSDEFGGWLTVLHGGCDGWLENCGAFGFPTIVDFEAIAGEEYTFVIDGEVPDAQGYFEFNLEPLSISNSCPSGELFNVPESIVGSTFGAENGFSSNCGGDEAPDQSFVFYAPYSGAYRIHTIGSNFDTVLHVFEGYCGNSLLGCNDDTFDVQSEVVTQFTAGYPYTIVVDGWGGASGEYQLNLEFLDGLGVCDNIDFLDSVVPAGAGWVSEFTSIDVFQQCVFAPNERRFLWYAPDDGVYKVSQETGGLFSGLSVLLGGCAQDPVICQQGPEPIVFEAFAGQEIVFVSEWEFGPTTDISLLVEGFSVGPGCGTPIPSQVPVVVQGTTNGAGDDYWGSCASNPVSEVEYWYSAPQTGSYLISLDGSAYDTLMYVRDGGCDGEEIACNDDTFDGQQVYLWSSVPIDLVAGQTISIFVDGYSNSGSYQLSITEI
jgi:hypothetical protein